MDEEGKQPFLCFGGRSIPSGRGTGSWGLTESEDWRRGGCYLDTSSSQTGWEGSSRSVGICVEARWQKPNSVLSVMVMPGSSPFSRWWWMALKYAFMSCMISVSCDGETEREREREGSNWWQTQCLSALSQMMSSRTSTSRESMMFNNKAELFIAHHWWQSSNNSWRSQRGGRAPDWPSKLTPPNN